MEREIQMVKKLFWQAATLCWMIVIFLFSSQPATESGELSDGLLFDILDWLNIEVSISTGEFLSVFIRKAAHFSIYAILGVLVFVCIGVIFDSIKCKKRALSAEIVCMCYAISDEVHQLFVPGRSGAAVDVLLDSIGAVTGIALIGVFFCIAERRKRNG